MNGITISSLHYVDPLCTHKVSSKLSVIGILDLQVTEKQLRSLLYAVQFQFLSLAAASGSNYLLGYELYSIYLLFVDSQFPIDMDPLKLVVSVIHNTESIQKGMEAELSREREQSLVMTREMHAKEMQIQSMKIESLSGMFSYMY